jgi:hypothetical protein
VNICKCKFLSQLSTPFTWSNISFACFSQQIYLSKAKKPTKQTKKPKQCNMYSSPSPFSSAWDRTRAPHSLGKCSTTELHAQSYPSLWNTQKNTHKKHLTISLKSLIYHNIFENQSQVYYWLSRYLYIGPYNI